MLTQDRYNKILNLLNQKSSITLAELTEVLNVSESTIRRDLNALDKLGKLRKVHGGATSLQNYLVEEVDLATKADIAIEEKRIIAKYAASLVNPNDLVFIDAGTTTEYIIEYLTEYKATYITNGISHAQKLINAGFKSFIIGGELKQITGAIIGTVALECISHYNFTLGFFGTNGISLNAGYSTPDPIEGAIKRAACKRCLQTYILADSSKFDKTASVTFAPLEAATILTDKLVQKKYAKHTQIQEVLNK